MSRFDELFSAGLISGTLSGPRKGETPEKNAKKVTLRSFEQKGETVIQFTFLLPDRALHENRSPAEAGGRVEELLQGGFSQAVLFGRTMDLHATCLGHPPRLKVKRQPPAKAETAAPAAHDRAKRGVFADGEPCAFLEGLGVMNAAGKVYAGRQDKLRQINKYLELAREPLEYAAARRADRAAPLQIVDFGCGKAYLTFAIHWYCREVLGIPCETLGVDLKADVLADCTALAERLGMEGITFYAGDIADAEPRPVDLVITLHACDTATDLALAYGVQNGANAIVSVPCCQHELFRQIRSEVQSPLLRGILKERVSALVTDAGRAQLLEAYGYKVEAVEFIDAEHTPKNIMLRCTRRPGLKAPGEVQDTAALQKWRTFAAAWQADPALARLLGTPRA